MSKLYGLYFTGNVK